MPLLRIDIRKGRKPEEVKALCNTIHRAVVACFRVPERDRYQIVHEHEGHTLVVEDTGLDIHRTDQVVVISMTSRPRSEEAKLAFYELVCTNLKKDCGIDSSDVMVNITVNADSDWSFGYGRAQFVAGDL
ncbi:MAG: tautomerase family protein [Rhodanobacter sp.]